MEKCVGVWENVRGRCRFRGCGEVWWKSVLECKVSVGIGVGKCVEMFGKM